MMQRIGSSDRWSDVVISSGTAYWVEVASDMTQDVRGQISQVLAQIDETLLQIGSDRHQMIQILVYLSDLQNMVILNELWDAWVPKGFAPVRACVGVQLGSHCKVEMVVTAGCRP